MRLTDSAGGEANEREADYVLDGPVGKELDQQLAGVGESGRVDKILGRPAESFASWVAGHRALFPK